MGERQTSSVGCGDVADSLAGVAAGESTLGGAEREHVDHCLRCQAEVVQHRKILRTMRQLRDEVIEPVPGLLPEMLAQVHDIGERSAVRSLVARRHVRYTLAIAGLGVGAAAGTVLTVRLRRSSRSRHEESATEPAPGDAPAGAG